MHIVHIYDGHEQVHNGRGSVPQVVWHLAQHAAKAGNKVTVIERKWEGLEEVSVEGGVRFDRINLSTGSDKPWSQIPYEQVSSVFGSGSLILDRTNFALHSYAKLRDIEYDILHFHLPFAANVLLTIAPKIRDESIYTAHLGELRLNSLSENQKGKDNSETGLSSPGILSLFSPDIYLSKRVAHTTVLNKSIKQTLVNQGIERGAISVLPNGVNIDRYSNISSNEISRVKKKYNIGEKPMVLFVGTVMPRKGVTDLIEAISELNGEGEELYNLVIVGEDDLDGEYVDRVVRMIEEKQLEAPTSMLGFVPDDDLPPIYAAADVSVVPSLEEGFGMTVIESLASGTPVVGTQTGAIPEIINPGKHGEVVSPGSPKQLAKAIRSVVQDLPKTTNVSTAARNRAHEYSWESVGKMCLEIYNRVQK